MLLAAESDGEILKFETDTLVHMQTLFGSFVYYDQVSASSLQEEQVTASRINQIAKTCSCLN